jgi:hypothetical protein
MERKLPICIPRIRDGDRVMTGRERKRDWMLRIVSRRDGNVMISRVFHVEIFNRTIASIEEDEIDRDINIYMLLRHGLR